MEREKELIRAIQGLIKAVNQLSRNVKGNLRNAAIARKVVETEKEIER